MVKTQKTVPIIGQSPLRPSFSRPHTLDVSAFDFRHTLSFIRSVTIAVDSSSTVIVVVVIAVRAESKVNSVQLPSDRAGKNCVGDT